MKCEFPALIKKRFDDVVLGQAFLCLSGTSSHIGVKAQVHGADGAVSIAFPDETAPPSFLHLHDFAQKFDDNVLVLEDLRLTLFPSLATGDVRRGHQIQPGRIYLFEDGNPHLASVVWGSPGSASITDYLLNVNSGEIKLRQSFRDMPIEISNWALVAEIWGQPRTLFSTYASGSLPRKFGI